MSNERPKSTYRQRKEREEKLLSLKENIKGKLKSIFNVKSKKRKVAATALAVSLLGASGVGIDYTYQEATEKKILAKVESVEKIERKTSEFTTITVKNGQKKVVYDSQGKPVPVPPSVKEELKDTDIEYRVRVSYYDYAGGGDIKATFNNSSEWLQQKSEKDAERLFNTLQVGQEYWMTVVGKDFGLVDDRNIIEAKKYERPAPVKDYIRPLPLFDLDKFFKNPNPGP